MCTRPKRPALGRGCLTNRSSSFAVIVAQQCTQPLVAFNVRRDVRLCLLGKQQNVALALVVALLVVVRHVIVQGPLQAALTEQDQLG